MSVATIQGLAWAIFLVSYFVFAVGRLPGTRVDRPSMAILGVVAMFAVGALDARHAIAALDFQTLVLLASMMVLVAVLHLEGFFEWVTHQIVERLEPSHPQ